MREGLAVGLLHVRLTTHVRFASPEGCRHAEEIPRSSSVTWCPLAGDVRRAEMQPGRSFAGTSAVTTSM